MHRSWSIFRDFLRRSLLIFLGLGLVAQVLGVLLNMFLIAQSAEQLTRSFRNELLAGNSMYAIKQLNAYLGDSFVAVIYREGSHPVFSLPEMTGADRPMFPSWLTRISEGTFTIPVCFDAKATTCGNSLVFRYSHLRFALPIALGTLVLLLIYLAMFYLLRQRILASYQEQFKRENEAELGRMSARICHDLKLPALIFRRVLDVRNHDELMEIKPQIESHFNRLMAMIDKLKRADLESLLRMESCVITQASLKSLLQPLVSAQTRLIVMVKEPLSATLDLEKFERGVANLVLNAEQVGSSLIEVRVSAADGDLIVTVENLGPAFPLALQQVINQGLTDNRLWPGLGLRFTFDMVRGHGGHMQVDSEVSRTRITLKFPGAIQRPLIQEASTPQPTVLPSFQPEPLSRSFTVFCDEAWLPRLRSAWAQMSWEPIVFQSKTSQLALCHVVVTDDNACLQTAISASIPSILPGQQDPTLICKKLRNFLRKHQQMEKAWMLPEKPRPV